jgi:DNA-binding winged helix-turn-helix (wHTH) protein
VDADRRQVFRNGAPVHVSPRGFALLTMLIAQRPRALSKDQLLEALWPVTFVCETNLATLANEIRQAIGDSRPWRFVRTVHGFGYAFDVEVREDHGGEAAPGAARPRWVLVGPAGEVPIAEGEHVIGRGRDARIPLEGALVSRRHAMLVADADSLVIEDLGSRNGTLVGGSPVVGPRRLEHQDLIWIGSQRLRVVDLEALDETLAAAPALQAARR